MRAGRKNPVSAGESEPVSVTCTKPALDGHVTGMPANTPISAPFENWWQPPQAMAPARFKRCVAVSPAGADAATSDAKPVAALVRGTSLPFCECD
jgi:hypothetical protein